MFFILHKYILDKGYLSALRLQNQKTNGLQSQDFRWRVKPPARGLLLLEDCHCEWKTCHCRCFPSTTHAGQSPGNSIFQKAQTRLGTGFFIPMKQENSISATSRTRLDRLADPKKIVSSGSVKPARTHASVIPHSLHTPTIWRMVWVLSSVSHHSRSGTDPVVMPAPA